MAEWRCSSVMVGMEELFLMCTAAACMLFPIDEHEKAPDCLHFKLFFAWYYFVIPFVLRHLCPSQWFFYTRLRPLLCATLTLPSCISLNLSTTSAMALKIDFNCTWRIYSHTTVCSLIASPPISIKSDTTDAILKLFPINLKCHCN